MTMEGEPFRYTPLTSPSHTIRVLALLPSPKIASQLNIKLREVSLDAPQLNFRALSYVWGDAKDAKTIHIGGKPLQVTKNCEAALRSLRQPNKETSLWIDAICIDQSNVSERSQQVALMGEIYRKVEGIVAFLGQENLEESNLSLGRQFLYSLAGFEEDGNKGEVEQFNAFYQEIVVPGRATWSKCCQELRRIFGQPWWERLWVYQEIMFARQAELLLGPGETLEWDVLEKAVEVMYKYTAQPKLWVQKDYLSESSHNQESWKAMRGCGFIVAYTRAKDRNTCLREQDAEHKLEVLRERSGILDVEKDRQDELWEAEVWSQGFSPLLPAMLLEKRLFLTKHLKCSDPRDRIYAILGIVKTRSHAIVADYSKRAREVYHEFAKALAPKTLEFMRDAGFGIFGTVMGSSYPSWSPDWENCNGKPPERLRGKHCAAGNERTFTEVLEDGHTLSTAAYYLDEVEEVLPMPFTPSLHEDEFRLMLHSFESTDWKSRKHMLVCTLTGGTDEFGRRLTNEKVVEWAKSQLVWPSEYDPEDEEMDEDSEEYGSEYDDLEKGFAGLFDATIGFARADMSKGRRFMRTIKGRMVLGPQCTMNGDLIYILPGCSVPLVFRKEKVHKKIADEWMSEDCPWIDLDEDVDDEDEDDEHLILVGECFVHGMMDGEALEGHVDLEIVTVR